MTSAAGAAGHQTFMQFSTLSTRRREILVAA